MVGEKDPQSETGAFKENEAYDPATDSWRALAPLRTPRHGFGAAVFDETVYHQVALRPTAGASKAMSTRRSPSNRRTRYY